MLVDQQDIHSATLSKLRILFFSFHYPPDQSAGSYRAKELAEALQTISKDTEIRIFCSQPRRYGVKFNIQQKNDFSADKNLKVVRFWAPYFGRGPLASVASYAFYFAQAIPASILYRPQIVIGTSAKLLTSLVAAIASKANGAKLFLDIRDTFADNFFYFYRWNKRILAQSLILGIENVVLRCATAINMVSLGFKEAFYGWDRLLYKYGIEVTNFPNGITQSSRAIISSASRCRQKNDKASSLNDFFKVAYCGNLGEGQDLFTLFKNLTCDPESVSRLISERICINIYGSGSQLENLRELTISSSISGLLEVKGIIPRDEMPIVYGESDCLMLQLGEFSSLSMVIPTKVFEYCATNKPIIYGASGFTEKFISNISGAIPFSQNNPASFVDSLIRSKSAVVDVVERDNFLDSFNSSLILKKYSRSIMTAAGFSHRIKPTTIPGSFSSIESGSQCKINKTVA
ncbi:hypothetical protein [Synechococcus sp. Minos11]|uniref:hypothetical protein n=1 Tax=Synechococcus sp. Minos11 TaxID=221341 RepID=UPI001646CA76|nr:hypothetical protein [Synechococcus sp. Minos11]